MSKPRQPLLLRLEFAFEVEHAGYALKPIERAIGRDFWKCAHGKRSVAFVIVTQESSRELASRLQLDAITSIEDWSCHVAPIGAISKHGGMSTLHAALQKAWAALGQRRSSAYQGQRQRLDPRTKSRVEDREFGGKREWKRRSEKSHGNSHMVVDLGSTP